MLISTLTVFVLLNCWQAVFLDEACDKAVSGGAVQDLKSQFTALQAQVQGLAGQVNLLRKSLLTRKRRAFHATGSPGSTDIHVGKRVDFKIIKVNHHGGYNVNTSTFTCDNDGLYYFYVTIASYGYGYGYGMVWFEIMQDNQANVNGVTGNAAGSVGSLFALIQCRPGRRVWVRQGHIKPAWKQGMWTRHSQFGGFELFV